MNLLNAYELRARVAPAIIVTLPLVITLVSLLSLLRDPSSLSLQLISSGVISLVLIYIASFFVRYNGQKIESEIWNRWNGAPSTRFMRWSDQTFSNELKRKLHKTIKLNCGIDLKSKGEELNDPVAADKKIIQAFSEVRAIVRLKDPNGVWLIQNAEYGFHRNLYGSRWAWLILSSLGILICTYAWLMWKNDTILLGVIFNGISFLAAILFGWYYIPKFMFWAANRYAESVWTTFLVLADKKQTQE